VVVEVGPAPTLREYREAMRWLVSQDVDVVVDAGSYFPRSAATADGFAEATDRASEQGVVVVTSAGNFGDRHWEGVVTEPGWVAFDSPDGSEANPLGDGRIAGDVSLRLHAPADADVELFLYRRHPTERDTVVARADASDGVAAVDATVPRGTYYVAVRVGDATDRPTLGLYAPSHDLGYATASGSVPETAGETALSVGAVAPDGGLRADSSRGSLTVAAPGRAETSVGDLEGTSAAAPYVAGSVALLQASTGVDAAESRRILVETADRENGVARIDLDAAWRRARSAEAGGRPTPENESRASP